MAIKSVVTRGFKFGVNGLPTRGYHTTATPPPPTPSASPYVPTFRRRKRT